MIRQKRSLSAHTVPSAARPRRTSGQITLPVLMIAGFQIPLNAGVSWQILPTSQAVSSVVGGPRRCLNDSVTDGGSAKHQHSAPNVVMHIGGVVQQILQHVRVFVL